MSVPLEVFCCYAREDLEMLEHLKKHLMPLQRSGQIKVWSDTNLNAGVEWEKELRQHLESANLFLLLISSDFMNSEYCYSTEMKRAIERHDQGNAVVIPILLRATLWDGTPFAKLQVLPRNARPVRGWSNIDEAFTDVVKDIKGTIEDPTHRIMSTPLREELSTTRSPSFVGERFLGVSETFYEEIKRKLPARKGTVIVKVHSNQVGEEYYLLPKKLEILLSGKSSWQSVVPPNKVLAAIVRRHPGGIYAAVFEALDPMDFLIWKGPLESDLSDPDRRRGITVHAGQVEEVVFD